ncbi:MAG: hypothetical protein KC592_05425 [Nitrospira sp.]|nr:hypothetical protein [Nitrospira sp.]HNP30719.1 hypothetical protein [Nitrospirales bacterium]
MSNSIIGVLILMHFRKRVQTCFVKSADYPSRSYPTVETLRIAANQGGQMNNLYMTGGTHAWYTPGQICAWIQHMWVMPVIRTVPGSN